jgi:flavin-dependent dehydrogenase
MRYDVVVVGARVAGASTAMLLARAGARVLLLERGRPGADTVSTHALMRAGVLQLSRWGLLDRIVAAGTPPISTTTFRYPGEQAVPVAIRPSPGVDALYAPRRTLLDATLVAAAVDAGAQVRHGCAVTGLLRNRSGRVSGVVTPDGVVAADVVVGADGVRSTVAEAAGAGVLATGRYGGAVRYTYLDLTVAGTEWFYGDGVAAGAIPTNDGRTCVFVSSTPARIRSMWAGQDADRAWRAALTLVAADHPVLGARRAERLYGWRGVPGRLRQAFGPGWVLVGDAGFYKDPMSTHGITDALRDAELAAAALIEMLGGHRTALAAYAHRRDALAGPLLQVSDEIASYAWRGSEAAPLVKRLSLAMVDEVALLEGLAARSSTELDDPPDAARGDAPRHAVQQLQRGRVGRGEIVDHEQQRA